MSLSELPEVDPADPFVDRVLQGDPLVGKVGPDGRSTHLELALAAAAVEVALAVDVAEGLPAGLISRLEADAARFLGGEPSHGSRRPLALRVAPWLGWAVAACLLVLVLLQPRAREGFPAGSQLAGLPGESPSIGLSPTDHPLARGGGGKIVWDQSRQRGFLELRGLAEVDPGSGTYQLWIFDAGRDGRYPLDGGVFSIADARATTIVPIRVGLPVRRPTLFAITLEPPGGVVVSDRKRILLTANWGG